VSGDQFPVVVENLSGAVDGQLRVVYRATRVVGPFVESQYDRDSIVGCCLSDSCDVASGDGGGCAYEPAVIALGDRVVPACLVEDPRRVSAEPGFWEHDERRACLGRGADVLTGALGALFEIEHTGRLLDDCHGHGCHVVLLSGELGHRVLRLDGPRRLMFRGEWRGQPCLAGGATGSPYTCLPRDCPPSAVRTSPGM